MIDFSLSLTQNDYKVNNYLNQNQCDLDNKTFSRIEIFYSRVLKEWNDVKKTINLLIRIDLIFQWILRRLEDLKTLIDKVAQTSFSFFYFLQNFIPKIKVNFPGFRTKFESIQVVIQVGQFHQYSLAPTHHNQAFDPSKIFYPSLLEEDLSHSLRGHSGKDYVLGKA